MEKTGSFDLREIKDLQRRLSRMQDPEEFVDSCTRELAGMLLNKVIKRTPTGRAPKDIRDNRDRKVEVLGAGGKKRKFFSREAAIYKKYWAGYRGGELKRGWTAEGLHRTEKACRIRIINPKKYAAYVEYGHRQEPGRYVPALGKRLKRAWVPGQGMMTKSEQEVRREAPGKLNQRMNEYFGGMK